MASETSSFFFLGAIRNRNKCDTVNESLSSERTGSVELTDFSNSTLIVPVADKIYNHLSHVYLHFQMCSSCSHTSPICGCLHMASFVNGMLMHSSLVLTMYCKIVHNINCNANPHNPSPLTLTIVKDRGHSELACQLAEIKIVCQQ